MAAVEIEGIDLQAVSLAADADAARALVADQDQAQSRLVEMFAEDAARTAGLEAADAFEILAHHVDAQHQKRLEFGFARRAERPVRERWQSWPRAAWRRRSSPWCRAPSSGRGGRR